MSLTTGLVWTWPISRDTRVYWLSYSQTTFDLILWFGYKRSLVGLGAFHWLSWNKFCYFRKRSGTRSLSSTFRSGGQVPEIQDDFRNSLANNLTRADDRWLCVAHGLCTELQRQRPLWCLASILLSNIFEIKLTTKFVVAREIVLLGGHSLIAVK